VAGTQFKQGRGGNRTPNDDGIVGKLPNGRNLLGLQVVQEAADDVVNVPTAFAKIVIFEAPVCLAQIIRNLLNRPFGIDSVRFDLCDDAIHEKPVLKDQKVSIDEKRKILRHCARLNCACMRRNWHWIFSTDSRKRATSPETSSAAMRR
jgi:hypothetical protein